MRLSIRFQAVTPGPPARRHVSTLIDGEHASVSPSRSTEPRADENNPVLLRSGLTLLVLMIVQSGLGLLGYAIYNEAFYLFGAALNVLAPGEVPVWAVLVLGTTAAAIRLLYGVRTNR